MEQLSPPASLVIGHRNNIISIREQNSAWREALSMATHQSIPKGKRWMGAGTSFAFLDRGMIRLSSLDRNGNERILLYIGSGCIFNELGILNRVSFEPLFTFCTITALEDCEIYNFPKSLLQDEAFTLAHPRLMMNLVQSLACKAGAFFSQLDESTGLAPETQICRYLYRAVAEETPSSRPHFSQTELALALGLHRSTVCRILRQLRDDGILGVFTRRRLEILDKDALWKRCRPNDS